MNETMTEKLKATTPLKKKHWSLIQVHMANHLNSRVRRITPKFIIGFCGLPVHHSWQRKVWDQTHSPQHAFASIP